MLKKLSFVTAALLLCLCTCTPTLSGAAVPSDSGEGLGTAEYLNHLSHDLPIWVQNCVFSRGGLTYRGADVFYNVSDNTYQNWASVEYSYLTQLEDGGFLRLEPKAYKTDYSSAYGSGYYDSETGIYYSVDWSALKYSGEDALIAETYSKELVLEGSVEIAYELPLFGGFYCGKTHNYIVFGQKNADNSDSVEVVRIVKYAKDWTRLGACSVYGANTNTPFNAGGLRMTEANGILYVYTCHKMYGGHQANMTFAVNEQDMTLLDSLYAVWNISGGYVSHSFNQFIETDGSYVYRVDHGDAYPRAVTVTRIAVGDSVKNVLYKSAFTISLGDVGENYTGVSVGGFAVGAGKLAIAGNSVDQTNADDFYNNDRNIFVSLMDKDLENVKVVWLTDYAAEDDIQVGTPQLVGLGGDEFFVLWEEYDTTAKTVRLCSATVDGDGDVKGETVYNPFRLSDCQPILCLDGTVKWYVSYEDRTVLYSVDPQRQSSMVTLGDVNGDGSVDNLDAAYVLKYSANIVTFNEAQKIAADVNGDGKVNSLDAAAILKYDAGLITEPFGF